MQTTHDSLFSTSSSPFILDPEMSNQVVTDSEFDEFFDPSSLPLTSSATSPGVFLGEDLNTGLADFGSTDNHKNGGLNQSSFLDARIHQSLETSSPSGSYQDSASDSSRYKRKSSSSSDRSSGEGMMDGVMHGYDWDMKEMLGAQGTTLAHNGTINPAQMDASYEAPDKYMEDSFDFDSASNSPHMFADSPEATTEKQEAVERKGKSPAAERREGNPASSMGLNRHSKVNWVCFMSSYVKLCD